MVNALQIVYSTVTVLKAWCCGYCALTTNTTVKQRLLW